MLDYIKSNSLINISRWLIWIFLINNIHHLFHIYINEPYRFISKNHTYFYGDNDISNDKNLHIKLENMMKLAFAIKISFDFRFRVMALIIVFFLCFIVNLFSLPNRYKFFKRIFSVRFVQRHQFLVNSITTWK